MKVFITGSSGLIGRWTSSRLLAENHQVIGFDRSPAPFTHSHYTHQQGDICRLSLLLECLKQNQPEVVIHLAARTDLNGNTIDDYRDNTEGTRVLLRCLHQIKTIKRALLTSSQLVCRIGYVPKTDQEYCPDTPYGESKARMEQIVREEEQDGIEWCLVRPTTVWGPFMSDHYRRLLQYIEKGYYFHVGHGMLYKSYAYAGNIAWQYFRLMVAPASQIHRHVFYLADYQPLSLRAYAACLQESLGAPPIRTLPILLARALALFGDLLAHVGFKRAPFTSFRLRNILTEYQFDLRKTQAVCGSLPFSFEQGIKTTVAWHRHQWTQLENAGVIVR